MGDIKYGIEPKYLNGREHKMIKGVKRKSVRILIFVLLLFIVSRLGIYTLAYLGNNLFSKYTEPPSYSTATEQIPPKMNLAGGVLGTHFPTLKDFVKFDSDFYLRIAANCYNQYKMAEKHPPADWPFFPLYPFLIALVNAKFPFSMISIGYFLSNLFGVLGLYYLYRIAEELTGDEDVARKSVIYILIYPASIYLSVIYTESLFLFLSTMSMYMLLRRRMGWSIFLASLSTVARIPGFVNLAAIAWILLKDSGFRPLKIKLKYYAGLLAACIPLFSFLTYMYFLTGDFLAPFHEMANWGRTASAPFAAFFIYPFQLPFISAGGWDLSLAGFIFTAFVLIIYFLYARNKFEHIEYVIYGVILVLIPLTSATTSFTSMVRYFMVSFPMFIYMGIIGKKHPAADFAFTMLFFTFNAIYTIGYINTYYFVV